MYDNDYQFSTRQAQLLYIYCILTLAIASDSEYSVDGKVQVCSQIKSVDAVKTCQTVSCQSSLNDCIKVNKEELAQYDPQGYEAVEKAWKIEKSQEE